jgi:large subunit ribosomal protein L17
MNTQPKKNTIQGKKTSHRNAIIHSLVLELIRNERLQSTPRKVAILKSKFDRLVTHAKKQTPASKRLVESYLNNEKATEKLLGKLVPRLSDKNSGYTHTARTLPRKGDNAEQTIILVHGAEMKEKQSRLQKLLARQEEKSKKPKAGEVKIEKNTAKKAVGKKDSLKSIRRNTK